MTTRTFEDKNFIGDHPPIMMPGVLSGGSHVSGTVVGIVTASGKKVQLAPAASDGSEAAAAILYGDVDASEGDEPAVFMEHGEAIEHYLTWPDGITENQKAAAIVELKALGIFVK
ncbi:MAG: head decoration protein [Desulfobacterales bacterium]|nr:head decoration protein [Desulfobacterales bacterium]